jgi:predicted nucleotidyltransferase
MEKISENMIPERVSSLADSIAREFYQRFKKPIALYWFGSWIKGTATIHSDIDLAIKNSELIEPRSLVSFRNWLDDLPTLYSIDLVEFEKCNKKMQQEIKRFEKKL